MLSYLLFTALDADQSGLLSVPEWHTAYEKLARWGIVEAGMAVEQQDALFASVDISGDKEIDLFEFRQLIKCSAKKVTATEKVVGESGCEREEDVQILTKTQMETETDTKTPAEEDQSQEMSALSADGGSGDDAKQPLREEGGDVPVLLVVVGYLRRRLGVEVHHGDGVVPPGQVAHLP